MHNDQLRPHFRQARSSLTSFQQQQNALLVSQLLNVFFGFRRKLKIAAYLSVQSELSLNPWIATYPAPVYLPKLYEPIEPRLRFAALTEKTRWIHNRFGIIEPRNHWGQTLHAHQLDYILMPLVAFDRSGHRLGMGGGYYDRSLSFRKSRKKLLKPGLIGIAHSCQEHADLPCNPWDVDLDWIITEKEIIKASKD